MYAAVSGGSSAEGRPRSRACGLPPGLDATHSDEPRETTMRIRLLHLWEQLRSSYWFVPSLMTMSAIVLAFVMLGVDERVKAMPFWAFRWLYRGGMDGAKAVLSTTAGAPRRAAGGLL